MPVPLPEGSPDRQPSRDTPNSSARAGLSHPSPRARSPFMSSRNLVIVHQSSVTLICDASRTQHAPFSPQLSRCLPPRRRLVQDFFYARASRLGALLLAPLPSGQESSRTPESPGFGTQVVDPAPPSCLPSPRRWQGQPGAGRAIPRSEPAPRHAD